MSDSTAQSNKEPDMWIGHWKVFMEKVITWGHLNATLYHLRPWDEPEMNRFRSPDYHKNHIKVHGQDYLTYNCTSRLNFWCFEIMTQYFSSRTYKYLSDILTDFYRSFEAFTMITVRNNSELIWQAVKMSGIIRYCPESCGESSTVFNGFSTVITIIVTPPL